MTTNGLNEINGAKKNGGKVTVVATVSISTIITVVSIFIFGHRQAEQAQTTCNVKQLSAYYEATWNDFSHVLTAIEADDSVTVEFYLDKISNNPSLEDRIEENC